MKTEWIGALALAIGGLIITTSLIAFFAFLSGTIVWLIWPYAIPAAFPGLVASGTLAAKLSWFSSVCLAWLSSILLKTTLKSSEKKEKKKAIELEKEKITNDPRNRFSDIKLK
jgi:hypothetical protein